MASGDGQGHLLEYLKSLSSGNVDIAASKAARTGLVQVRQGRVVAAAWGRLCGNGALLTIAAMPEVSYQALESTKGVVGNNVTLTVPLVERLLSALSKSSPVDEGDAEAKLEQVIHLFYQFRRKEAGALLVEILRTNRFFYPAWLWQSRLMTRSEYIGKALNEAKKWGNSDRDILLETARIEPRLHDSAAEVKRCIFCFSVVQQKDDGCPHCLGRFYIAGQKAPVTGSSELEKAIAAYERELTACPGNSRIAYCLALGFYSLGKFDRAQEFIGKALKTSPGEQLFLRARAVLATLVNSSLGNAAPASLKPAPTPQPRPAPAPSRTGSPGLRPVPGKTILVVEDSQTSRKVITMLLERKGYAILEAMNGAEALAILTEEVPDLVLLDLMLPDMSGYEVLARVRQSGETADTPVVMLTGKTNPADRMKGLHHGSNEYLTKPFDPAKLLAVLEKYLDHSVPERKTPSEAPPKMAAKIAPQMQKAKAPATRSTPIPAQPAPATPIAAPKAPPSRETPASEGSMKTILVVEDSPTSRKVISMVVAKRGYTVNEAATGAVALRKAQEGVPNLILLDAMLPDMSGYEILHRFKNDDRLRDVPVVMLTAKNNPVDRQKGLQGGSAAYLTKPFDPERLLAAIDEYLR